MPTDTTALCERRLPDPKADGLARHGQKSIHVATRFAHDDVRLGRISFCRSSRSQSPGRCAMHGNRRIRGSMCRKTRMCNRTHYIWGVPHLQALRL